GNDHVPDHPTAVCFVGIDAARHSQHSGHVHEVKSEMEADQEKPEMPFTELLAQHASSHLWIPIIERRKDHEENGTDQNVVKVRYDKIRVTELPVKWRNRQHDPRKARNQELKQKSDREHHRHGEVDPATPQSRQPIEYLDPGWH